MSVPAARTLLYNVKNLDNYLIRNYHQHKRSAAFELLMAQSFSRILNLPFYSSLTNDVSKEKKVLWNGTLDPIRKASDGPDCIITANGFNVILEVTKSTGSMQWRREGGPLVRHTEDMINAEDWVESDTYSVLLVTRIGRDTYTNFGGGHHYNQKIVMLDIEGVIKLLETVNLAFSMKNIEIRELFENLMNISLYSSSVKSYKHSVDNYLSRWMDEVLESEKSTYIAVKAYEVMKNINRMNIGEGEIYRCLYRHPYLKQYLKLIDYDYTIDNIVRCLLDQGLARSTATAYGRILNPVHCSDYSNRGNLIIDKVIKIWN